MPIKVLSTSDSDEWLTVLARTRPHDFHHLPHYHRVAEARGEGTACFFVYTEGEHTIGLPLLLRSIDPDVPDHWKDATSVYGYGGPITSGGAPLPREVIARFQEALVAELVGRGVVAVFSRLHPLLPGQHPPLSGLGECVATGTTLSIDLSSSEEQQQQHYSKKCRATLRRLHADGFVGVHDRERRYLPEFVEVYLETMRRVGAYRSYEFDRPYFDLLADELRDVLHLFVALKDGVVAAATLCTICEGIVQDHLGGTRTAFLKFSPDRLVVDTARRWATAAGAHTYHLGGGVGAQRDSVFKYKKGFSNRLHPFFTFRWVLRPEIYAELSAHAGFPREDSGPGALSVGYFPAYRCPAAGGR